MKALLLLLALSSVAFAEEELLIRLEVTSRSQEGRLQKLHEAIRIKNGATSTISISPEQARGELFQSWRCHPSRVSAQKIRLESQLGVSVNDGPRQQSKFSATLLEGEPWEASVETPDGKSTLEYRITAWGIPSGQKLLRFEKDGRPVWVTPANH